MTETPKPGPQSPSPAPADPPVAPAPQDSPQQPETAVPAAPAPPPAEPPAPPAPETVEGHGICGDCLALYFPQGLPDVYTTSGCEHTA